MRLGFLVRQRRWSRAGGGVPAAAASASGFRGTTIRSSTACRRPPCNGQAQAARSQWQHQAKQRVTNEIGKRTTPRLWVACSAWLHALTVPESAPESKHPGKLGKKPVSDRAPAFKLARPRRSSTPPRAFARVHGPWATCNGQAQAARSQCQHQAKQRVANKKASCQPGGFGSPAANGYTRQPCRSHPSPPSTQASYGRSLFPNECLQAGAATSKQHSDQGERTM